MNKSEVLFSPENFQGLGSTVPMPENGTRITTQELHRLPTEYHDELGRNIGQVVLREPPIDIEVKQLKDNKNRLAYNGRQKLHKPIRPLLPV